MSFANKQLAFNYQLLRHITRFCQLFQFKEGEVFDSKKWINKSFSFLAPLNVKILNLRIWFNLAKFVDGFVTGTTFWLFRLSRIRTFLVGKMSNEFEFFQKLLLGSLPGSIEKRKWWKGTNFCKSIRTKVKCREKLGKVFLLIELPKCKTFLSGMI